MGRPAGTGWGCRVVSPSPFHHTPLCPFHPLLPTGRVRPHLATTCARGSCLPGSRGPGINSPCPSAVSLPLDSGGLATMGLRGLPPDISTGGPLQRYWEADTQCRVGRVEVEGRFSSPAPRLPGSPAIRGLPEYLLCCDVRMGALWAVGRAGAGQTPIWEPCYCPDSSDTRTIIN